MALTEKLTAIGNAIRTKTGKSDLLTLAQMPNEILGIKTGGNEGESTEFLKWVTFLSETGSSEYGKKPVAVGDDCADPIARGIFNTPTKESTTQNNFSFGGWARTANGELDSTALKKVEEDRTVFAYFNTGIRSYTISFYDGTTLLKSQNYSYGVIPDYKPTKQGYDFVRWEPEITAVTGDASYTAVWKTKASFSTASWTEIIEAAQSGNAASVFSLGDERTETITYSDGTTEQITWVVVSLNNTVSAVDGTKDNVTIMAKHALKTSRSVRNAMKGSYESSELATYLNNDFYNVLPEALRVGIKEIYTYNSFYSSQKIWIPSLEELGLNRDNYGSGNARVFEYFDSNTKRIKKLGATGNATEYVTRSLRNSGSYTYYACVTASGTAANTARLPNETFAIVPCFSI